MNDISDEQMRKTSLKIVVFTTFIATLFFLGQLYAGIRNNTLPSAAEVAYCQGAADGYIAGASPFVGYPPPEWRDQFIVTCIDDGIYSQRQEAQSGVQETPPPNSG